MNDYEKMKEKALELVASSNNQRMQPSWLKQTLSSELDVSQFVANEVIEDLVEAGELVYAYRDPDSYVEIPCNGCDGDYRAARPMKVVADGGGGLWLCDADVEPGYSLSASGCWECGSMEFTRAD